MSDRVWVSASRRLPADPCWVTPWHLPDELGEQASILGRESLGHLDIAWQVSCHFNIFAGSAGLPSPIRPLGRASIARLYPIDFANEGRRWSETSASP